MNIIRQIKREVTETKERMVPELYEETSTQEFFVMELTTWELNEFIQWYERGKGTHHASNTHKFAKIRAEELREVRDAFLERREIK